MRVNSAPLREPWSSAAAQVTDIVEQPGEDADGGARGAQALRRILLALVADQQAREREGDVEGVLAIVVDGVDAVKAVDLACEQPLEMREGALQRLQLQLRPGGAEQRGQPPPAPPGASSPARCW